MRTLLLAVLLVSQFSHAEDIVEVLNRSRLETIKPENLVMEETELTKSLHKTFQSLRSQIDMTTEVEFKIIKGTFDAQAIVGRYIVATESIASLNESEKSFILGHELGHIYHGHWQQQCDLYKKFIPGEVTEEKTKLIEGQLGLAAHTQAYDQEFEADAFGYKMIRKMGYGLNDVINTLRLSPYIHGDASHPSANKRLSHLRFLESELSEKAPESSK